MIEAYPEVEPLLPASNQHQSWLAEDAQETSDTVGRRYE